MNTYSSLAIDDLLYAMQQRNLVYNYNFLNYSNETVNTIITYGHPDGWVYQDSGPNGKIGFDPLSNCCVINKSSDNSVMIFQQAICEFPRWRDAIGGKCVSACALIKTPNDCEITFALDDGLNANRRSVFFLANEQKEISISLDVDFEASTLAVSVMCSTRGAVIYIQKVYANLGNIALENLPCMVVGTIGERKQYVATEVPPANELSLCDVAVELSNEYTRLDSVLNGRFGVGPNGRSLLPDMRGYFSRAWDNGSGTDPDATYRTALGSGTFTGDHVGTVEQDAFKAHNHQLLFDTNGQITTGTSGAPTINKMAGSDTQTTGGLETRARNIAELYTMKWA